MKLQPVKGTRDFYPPQMALRNWIIDGWKKASLRNGFEEYDGPIFEYLKMFQLKSGDEIAQQLFSMQDRGGRDLAIRPEMTPTLARMVNQRINALPKPIKWFSVPRLCRAERPQKGRLREFFQWNIDIIGIDDVLADAQIIFCAVDYLSSIGLTPKDITTRISSRKMLAALLKNIGIEQDQLNAVYVLLDKRGKIPPEVFEKMTDELIEDNSIKRKVIDLMAVTKLEQIPEIVDLNDQAAQALDELKKLFSILEIMKIDQFCKFDISVVRGLAYYTGVVFEIYDQAASLRAIGGGGRYDNLLKDFGGPAIPATGFGMGDCVLEILLEEKGLLDPAKITSKTLDCFIATLDDKLMNNALSISSDLRRAGIKCDLSYKTSALGKQLKAASDSNAAKCIILGREFIDSNQVIIKDMSTGDQETVKIKDLIASLK